MNLPDLKTLTDRVGYCLRNFPDTRDSDITLMIRIWRTFYSGTLKGIPAPNGLLEAVLLKDLYELPREDAIKRVRAKFNEDGRYYPTSWEVAQTRGLKEDRWRNALGYPAKALTKESKQKESYMDQQTVENQGKLI